MRVCENQTDEQLRQLHDHYVEEINYLKQQLKEQQVPYIRLVDIPPVAIG